MDFDCYQTSCGVVICLDYDFRGNRCLRISSCWRQNHSCGNGFEEGNSAARGGHYYEDYFGRWRGWLLGRFEVRVGENGLDEQLKERLRAEKSLYGHH